MQILRGIFFFFFGLRESDEKRLVRTHQSYQFHTSSIELRLQFRKGAQFRRAHGREIRRVREQDRPFVADPFVEVDIALRGLGLEVRRQ